MNEWTTDPEEILETFAAEMRANMRQYSIWPGHYAVIVPRQLREHLVGGRPGPARTCASRLHERARIRRREWAGVGKGRVVRDRGDDRVSSAARPRAPAPDRGRRPGRGVRRSRSLRGSEERAAR